MINRDSLGERNKEEKEIKELQADKEMEGICQQVRGPLRFCDGWAQ